MTYQSSLSAISDPTRRAVLGCLRHGLRSVGAIARQVPVTRPAVSQHLRVLERARLVRRRRQGRHSFYSLDPAGLAPLRAYLDDFWQAASAQSTPALELATGQEPQ